LLEVFKQGEGNACVCVCDMDYLYMICPFDVCMFVTQRIWIEDAEGAEDKGGNWSISQGKRFLEAEGKGRNGRWEQVTILNVYIYTCVNFGSLSALVFLIQFSILKNRHHWTQKFMSWLGVL